MKFLGIVLIGLGVLFFVAGVIGGFGAFIWMIVLGIMEIVHMVEADAITTGAVFKTVIFFVLREVVACVIVWVSWLLGMICFSFGGAMYNE